MSTRVLLLLTLLLFYCLFYLTAVSSKLLLSQLVIFIFCASSSPLHSAGDGGFSRSTKLENAIPKSGPPSLQTPCLRTAMPQHQLPPSTAVRAFRLLDTAAREAQHHPGLATQPWNTEQALSTCTQGGTGGKGNAGLTLGAPFSHGSREGSRAGTGDLRADRFNTRLQPNTSQRQPHTHRAPPAKQSTNQLRNECRNLSKTGLWGETPPADPQSRVPLGAEGSVHFWLLPQFHRSHRMDGSHSSAQSPVLAVQGSATLRGSRDCPGQGQSHTHTHVPFTLQQGKPGGWNFPKKGNPPFPHQMNKDTPVFHDAEESPHSSQNAWNKAGGR